MSFHSCKHDLYFLFYELCFYILCPFSYWLVCFLMMDLWKLAFMRALHIFFHLVVGHCLCLWFFCAAYFYFHIAMCINFLRYSGFMYSLERPSPQDLIKTISHILFSGTSLVLFFMFKSGSGPGWCGSVDWVLACELKGHRFDSSQGTCLGCGPGPQLGACKRQHLSHMDVSLPLSLPLPLSKNK